MTDAELATHCAAVAHEVVGVYLRHIGDPAVAWGDLPPQEQVEWRELAVMVLRGGTLRDAYNARHLHRPGMPYDDAPRIVTAQWVVWVGAVRGVFARYCHETAPRA